MNKLHFKKSFFLVFIYSFLSCAYAGCQWEKVLDQNQIQVYTFPPDSMFHYKSIGIINSPIDRVYSFLKDFSLYSEWINYCSEIWVLDSILNQEYHYICLFDFPWPIRDRYAVIQLNIEIQPDSSKIIVKTQTSPRTPDEVPNALQITEFSEKYTLEKLNMEKTRLTMKGSYNPKGFIPLRLITKMLKWGPYDTIIKIRAYTAA